MIDVFITRDTGKIIIEVWPAKIGIRKFRGCTVYGAAWCEHSWTRYLYPHSNRVVECERITLTECRKRFGFCPRSGQAWRIQGKKHTKVDIAFSP